MTRKLNVLVLFDTAGTPPEDQDFTQDMKTESWKAERHVIKALRDLGHEVRLLGIYDDITLVSREIETHRPDIVFNMTEHFNGEPMFDRNIVGLLELHQLAYTGTPPMGLMLCKNKGISKKVLTYHRIRTPAFKVYHRGERVSAPKRLKYPILVKPLREEASYGISQNSLVDNDKDFIERIRFVHESMEQDVIAEEFVEGREFYVSLLGNHRLQVFPIRELVFRQMPKDAAKIATFKVKWDEKYRKKYGIQNRFAPNLSDEVRQKIERVCKKVYRHLYMRGYGRIDLRLTPENDVVVIEANPNPFIAKDEDFAMSAEKTGMTYPQLIQRILSIGLYN
jgi:D-alanine-D-alanine ligase